MSDLSILTQLPQVLGDWIPEAASIAVADKHKYIAYRPGAYDIRIEPGDNVRPGSIANRVFLQHGRVESEVDESVFGVPYYGLGYPFQTQNGLESAVTVILPSKRHVQRQPMAFVMGQAENLWHPLPVEEIMYFESYQKKTWLYTDTRAFTTNHTIQSLEDRLPADRFLRIHRSFIINVSFINFIERDDRSNLVITLKYPRQTRLTVTQTYVRHFRDSLGF